MLISLSWLKRYVQLPDDTGKLIADLTMAGLNVERCYERGLDDDNVVVGRVLHVEPHPNADKLRLCRVETRAGESREIVCGAPNVADGQFVIVALPGARLPDGTKIRSSKIRGVRSDGMICSERELGLGADAAGIMVLEGDPPVGAPISELVLPPDTVLEIEVTPNRPDLLCHVGVAREVAAIYGTTLEFPVSLGGIVGGRADFDVEIADPNDCARYVGKLVKGVTVGPSPAWLANAIESIGLQSRNNIVDITNFVMMELGQPIHAFDYRMLKGPKIVVRRAHAGEKLLTLDGTVCEPTPETLVIADDVDAVALAGLIGGEHSAVHDDTVDVLIESANFDAKLVRKARKSLGLVTDAAYRFERGANREVCLQAAQRAADLMSELGGGQEIATVDAYPIPFDVQTVRIRRAQTRRILGADLRTSEIEGLLSRLGFETATADEHAVTVRVPPHRLDINEEIDLIEEVARLYGYDRIGQGWRFRTTTFAQRQPFERFVDRLNDHLCSRGYTEVITSSFTDAREVGDFPWDADDPRTKPIPVRNPLSAQHGFLKTSLVPGMLDIVRRNLDQDTKSQRIYQFGKTFLAPDGTGKLPDEHHLLTIMMTMPSGTHFWRRGKEEPDLFEIKAEIEILLRVVMVDPGHDLYYDFDRSSGRFAYRSRRGPVVEGGVVTDRVATRYDFDQPVWHATVDLAALYDMAGGQPSLKPLPEYPASKRDLSLVAPEGVLYDDIEKHLVKSGGQLLESHHIFDVYRGEHVPEAHTAYGIRLSFRSPEKTLTDEGIDRIIDKILAKLKNELGVELRS